MADILKHCYRCSFRHAAVHILVRIIGSIIINVDLQLRQEDSQDEMLEVSTKYTLYVSICTYV